ncbi:MAG TPA: zeta toxin family protein [Mucilaginibacter sp.]|jgi:predicted ABC-type ATPase
MPDYTVIAGPNGAGKSTYSSVLSSQSALIFDADKVKAAKEKQYPDVPEESIEMMITSAYWETEEIAIAEKKDLTVESNLRDDFLINRISFFKNKGYTTNLIYLLLPDIETSTDRVAVRIAQKGHFIDPQSIKYNFEQGLVTLKKHFSKFDNLKIVDSSLDSNLSFLKTLLTIKNNNVIFIEANSPSWAKPILDEIIQKSPTN